MVKAADLRQIAMSLEGTIELPHFDRAAFKVARIYATLAADGRSANFKFTPDEQEMKCLTAPVAFAPVPNAWGSQGWTTASLAALSKSELKAALETAWRHALPRVGRAQAPKRVRKVYNEAPASTDRTPRRKSKARPVNDEINAYNERQSVVERTICEALAKEIDRGLPEAQSKIWHAHPVWFLDGNPIVGYSKLKGGIRLMFWSGASFGEVGLQQGTGKFKDASVRYASVDQIVRSDLKRWLEKARSIQWDYKNIVKRKGRLERLR